MYLNANCSKILYILSFYSSLKLWQLSNCSFWGSNPILLGFHMAIDDPGDILLWEVCVSCEYWSIGLHVDTVQGTSDAEGIKQTRKK